MVRSQLYIATFIILFFLTYLFVSNTYIIENNIKNFLNILDVSLLFYKIKNFDKMFKSFILLENKSIYFITVYYNCSYNVSIENFLNTENIIVMDHNYKFLKTFSNKTTIAFVPDGNIYYNDICIFKGFVVEGIDNDTVINNYKKAIAVIYNSFIKIRYKNLLDLIDEEFKIKINKTKVVYYSKEFFIER